MAQTFTRYVQVLVIVLWMLAAVALATPPGIAKNPSNARCMDDRYKECKNLVHVCPKFCPDSCSVNCVSCKPVCGNWTAPPVEQYSPPPPVTAPVIVTPSPPPPSPSPPPPPPPTPTPSTPLTPTPTPSTPTPSTPSTPTPTPSTPTPSTPTPSTPSTPTPSTPTPSTPSTPTPSTPTPSTPTPSTPTPSTPSTPTPSTPTPSTPTPSTPTPTPSTPAPSTPTPTPSTPTPSTPTPTPSTPTPSTPTPTPSTPTPSTPTPSTPTPSTPTPTPSTPSPSTPSTPTPSTPSTPTPSTPSTPTPSTPTPTPSTPTPSTPSTPTPSTPSTPSTPTPSTPSTPTPSTPSGKTPPTEDYPPPPNSPSPSTPTPTTPSPNTPSPSTPSSPSSDDSGQKRVRCKNRYYPQCYWQEFTCPTACPTGCMVDCASCKAVCHCDYPGAVCQDPRFIGGDGVTFYFHGKKDRDFCLVSDPDLHINGHFIGRRNKYMKRDFTWVQSIGILFGKHRLYVGARKTATWDDSTDRLIMSFNGEQILLPEADGTSWQSKTTTTVTINRAGGNTNIVAIEVAGKLKVVAKVVPITEHDSKVHNYDITPDDCFAHLDLSFKFYSLSNQVDGILGQTYKPGYVSRAKINARMPVMGGDDKFSASSLFNADCAAAQFTGISTAEDAMIELPSVGCSTRMDGRGVVCKK